ncbi:MAG: hypothetical protein ACYDGM_02730 [Vulcanimicrobiaceae bacterium]
MIVIRMRDARFIHGTQTVAGPLSLDVPLGARVAYRCAGAREAAIAARMAAGITKASHGSVTIGDYDPAVQPVHCKRLAGFVAHEPAHLEPRDFTRYIRYRAALWEVDPARALARAKDLLERLDGLHAAFAFPIVGALIASPSVLVMDRPAAAYAGHIIAAAAPCALFTTHIDRASAAAFSNDVRALHSA